MCTLLAAKTRSVRGASHPQGTMGSFLTICQMCLLFLHLVDGCRCCAGLGGSIVHCKIQNLFAPDSYGGCNVEPPPQNPWTKYRSLPQKWCVETMWEGYKKVICGVCQLSVAE